MLGFILFIMIVFSFWYSLRGFLAERKSKKMIQNETKYSKDL